MKKAILLFLAAVSILSCKPDQNKISDASNKAEQAPKLESKFNLKSLPESEMLRLYNEATYIDYIFYNLPFSLSQDNKASVHSNLKLMSSLPLDYLPMTCKPIGREFFHIDGEIVHEADLYFSDGCMGYVFIKDEKPIYANKISEGGIKFYNNIINQSKQFTNQAVNGQ